MFLPGRLRMQVEKCLQSTGRRSLPTHVDHRKFRREGRDESDLREIPLETLAFGGGLPRMTVSSDENNARIAR